MAYTIRIKRENPITLEEWKRAVESTTGVRLRSTDCSVVNPKTGEVITVAVS